jgi:DNA repair protein RecO (recombination protein O)
VHPVVTPALVLRLVDYGEADRIATLYSRDLGKLGALARGARRSRRRFGAALAVFNVGDATLVERRGAELARLDAFELVRDGSTLAGDLGRFTHASYAVELIRELTPPHHREPAIFDLGVGFLAALGAAAPRAELLRVFELRLLAEVGFMPAFDRCAACGGEDLDHPGQVFDVRRGGVLCRSCTGPGRGPVLPLPESARRAFVAAQRSELTAAAELGFAPADNAVLRDVALAIVQEHVGKPLKTVEFLHKLGGSRPRGT